MKRDITAKFPTRRAANYCCVIVLAGMFALVSLHAQASHRIGPSTRFSHLTIENGLLQNSATDILQDSTGFIWIGTEEGLHRYDGYHFTILRNNIDDPRSLRDNLVNVLFEDSRANLWVGTYAGGLQRFNPDTQDFDSFYHDPANPESLSDDYVAAIAEDESGELWVGTFNGLDILDPLTGVVRHVQLLDKTQELVTEFSTLAIHIDQSNKVWVGTVDGLFFYDTELTALRAAGNTVREQEVLAKHSATEIVEDFDGTFWIGMYGMLVHLDSEGNVVDVYKGPSEQGDDLPDGRVTSLLVTAGSELWVGTEVGGVQQLDRESGHFNTFRNDPVVPDSLSDNFIYSLMEDRTGLLWIGTQTGGVNILNPATRVFKHYTSHPTNLNTLPGKTVWAIHEDFQDNLWVATSVGLAKYNKSRDSVQHYVADEDDEHALNGPDVIALEEDRQRRLWIGTFDGLHRYDHESDNFIRYEFKLGDDENENLLANANTFVFQDVADRIWVGSSKGIFNVDPVTGKYTHYSVGTGTVRPDTWDFTLSITDAGSGNLWIGTEAGLVLFNPESGEFLERFTMQENSDPRLSGRFVQALHRDSTGILWIATSRGLDRLDFATREITNFGTAEGLPVETIYGILEDDSGDLWLSTNGGLSRFNKASRNFQNFDVTDGLQSNEFNGGAYFKANDGSLYFGGINGLTVFNPSEIQIRRVPPIVHITNVSILNRPIAAMENFRRRERLQFTHDENVLTISFAAFDYAAPSKNRFSYLLEGFDQEWRDARGINLVTYTNLDAGNYTFQVKGANSHGIWSDDTDVLEFTVLPPPWKAWWAYGLYGLLFGLLAWIAFRVQSLRMKHRHELDAEQQKRRWAEVLQKLTQSLSSSLDPQEVANSLMDNLQKVAYFRFAAMFIEQGVDLNLLGTRGFGEETQQKLAMMPETHSKLFEKVRHARLPVRITPEELIDMPFFEQQSGVTRFVAIPTFSRSDEFAMLLVGKDGEDFNEEEIRIIASFSTQATAALDNARLFAEIQNLATIDPLTRVNNRRYFFELAELEFSRSKRYKREVAVILLDADKFRDINDKHGHDIGDRVLKLIASTCRANLRHFDVIGRYGGEDFIIMLPETPLNIAADVADRLRQGIEDIRLSTHNGELEVTVSIGVALATGDVHDLPSLINKADMALYEAKRAGRNRVVVAE